MGATIPPEVVQTPARCHGRKHWLDWTIDERPCEYHVVVQYMNADGEYIGSSACTLNPGRLGDLCPDEAAEVWTDLVEKYEEHKTPDEIVVWLETKCLSKMFAEDWRGHRIVDVE